MDYISANIAQVDKYLELLRELPLTAIALAFVLFLFCLRDLKKSVKEIQANMISKEKFDNLKEKFDNLKEDGDEMKKEMVGREWFENVTAKIRNMDDKQVWCDTCEKITEGFRDRIKRLEAVFNGKKRMF